MPVRVGRGTILEETIAANEGKRCGGVKTRLKERRSYKVKDTKAQKAQESRRVEDKSVRLVIVAKRKEKKWRYKS